jgi:anaerobic magnesium-protoporphyrin IX monomethyl ester cyclase
MKIALVHARVSHNAVPPLGLLGLAATLRAEGLDCRVWDPLPGDERALDGLFAWRPDLVGVSFLTAQFARARALLSALRGALPEALLVIGGPHTSALPEASLAHLGADVAVFGEGERSLSEICARWAAKETLVGLPGTVVASAEGPVRGPARPPIDDLDALPFPDRDALVGSMAWYLAPPGVLRGLFRAGTTTLITSRGCPHRCSFCASHVVGGRQPRRRSVPHVLEELRWLQRRHGLRGAWFLDDDLAGSSAWMGQLCDAIGPTGLAWSCQARLDRLERPLLDAMARAGCVQIEVGVESGSDRILQALSKRQSVAEVEERMGWIKAAGMRLMANFMVGVPGETDADRQATLDLARRARPHFTEFNVCMPYPGSALWEQAVRDGAIDAQTDDFDPRWSEHFTSRPLLDAGLAPEALMATRAAMQNRFLWRNYAPIAAGLARSPRWQGIAARAALGMVAEEPRGVLHALAQRQLDPLAWRFYGRWSRAVARAAARRGGRL